MPYPHVTQFETLDLRRRIALASPEPVRASAPRRRRPLRARLRRRAAAGCVTSA